MNPLCFILGTRPELIKCAPLLRRCRDRSIPYTLIHTGQHYDHALDGIFFEELDIPSPTLTFSAGATTQWSFFGTIFPLLEQYFCSNKPACVLVQGDTNSAFAGAFVAQRFGIPVAHIEAGLRSFDLSMPEEVNRLYIDRIADRLYVPTILQKEHLLHEGISLDRILIAGNTIADAVIEHLPFASTHRGHFSTQRSFAVLTLHRPALVDNAKKLSDILHTIDVLATKKNIDVHFFVHPRTKKFLTQDSFSSISFHEPVGYFTMLSLLSRASVVLTDSGGLQEESALLQVPCITIRSTTERPETVATGGNTIVGFDEQLLEKALFSALDTPIEWKPLYEVSHPSDTILSDLLSRYL